MATLEISSGSVEPIGAVVTSGADPTGLTVKFNFTTDADDPSTGWVAGAWDGTAVLIKTVGGVSTYETKAKISVGTGTTFGALIEDTTYRAWVQVTDTPDVPVKHFAWVHVT